MSTATFNRELAVEIVARHERRPERLVQILVDMLRQFGHIPPEATALLADELNLSRADVHGVITYYHDFRTQPPGRHVLKLCQAEACRAVGAAALAKDVEAVSGLALGESSDALSVEPVYCLGNCALGPAAMFDGRPLGRVARETLETLLADLPEAVS